MELITIDSLFPEEPSRSNQSTDKTPSHSASLSDADFDTVKRNNITTNTMYNLMLKKGLITREEYHEMKQSVHLLMYPEDFA